MARCHNADGALWDIGNGKFFGEGAEEVMGCAWGGARRWNVGDRGRRDGMCGRGRVWGGRPCVGRLEGEGVEEVEVAAGDGERAEAVGYFGVEFGTGDCTRAVVSAHWRPAARSAVSGYWARYPVRRCEMMSACPPCRNATGTAPAAMPSMMVPGVFRSEKKKG